MIFSFQGNEKKRSITSTILEERRWWNLWYYCWQKMINNLLAMILTWHFFSVILYHSVFHNRCSPEKGYIRACLKSNVCLIFQLSLWGVKLIVIFCLSWTKIWFYIIGGGYVISPVSQGRQSVVKHMLAIDWKFWKSYLLASSAKYITIRMLGRVAGMFFDRSMNCCLL